MGKSKKSVLVGLCGRSGSGKGYVSALFENEGIPSIDTDRVYRELTAASDRMSPCMEELVAYFGDKIRNEDHSLNRAVLRTLVFGEENKENLRKLNEITHRHILSETERRADALADEGYPVVLIDAPVLFESGFDKFCTAVVCVTVSDELSVERIMKRDGLDRESAILRLKSQLSVEELRERSDFEIRNDTEKDVLIKRIKEVAEHLKELVED